MKFILSVLAVFALVAYVSCESCVQCTSETEERCATDPVNILAKDCRNSNSSLCYTRVLNGHTIRGCSSDLDQATVDKCTNELECVICTFMAGCNRQIFPQHRTQCLQCSSNSTNSTCATDVHAKVKVCPLYRLGDMCYIRNSQRLADGSFQRGCLSSAQVNKQCIKPGNCYTCDGHGCNHLEFNSTQIPLARDGASYVMIASISLLLFSVLVPAVM